MINSNRIFKSALIAAVSILVSSNALAWGDLGHQTVGEIAQRNLTPNGKKLVYKILGHGPLAEASTYPDLVRSDSDYSDFATFHFVEIDPRYNGDYSKIPSSLRPERDADNLISNIPEKLFLKFSGDQKFSKNQKQDLMRYLVHLVGDVHQPLHVGNGYDRGANWCNVKYITIEDGVKKTKSSNLHSFWDTALVEKIFAAQKVKDPTYKMPSWKGYEELADLIIADQKDLATDNVRKTPVLEWYKESQALHSKVYIDVTPVEPADRTYCMRIVKNELGEAVKDSRGVDTTIKATGAAEATEDYIQASIEIIKAQIMKAGLRLAETINTMAENEYRNGPGEGSYQDKKVQELKELLKEFQNH